jgi:flagellar motor protein MotB
LHDFFETWRKKGGHLENMWLITFADLMVQLMAFFAFVYSYTQIDTSNSSALIQALRKELGLKSTAAHGYGILPGSLGPEPDKAADLEKLIADMKVEEGSDEGVRLRVVTFRGSILFDEGSAVFNPDFQPYLDRIVTLSNEYPGYNIVIEGHTAPRERRLNGGDAWTLSGERAQAVARKLVSLGMDPAIIIPESRGDSVVESDASSPEGRSMTRQVRFRFQRVDSR